MCAGVGVGGGGVKGVGVDGWMDVIPVITLSHCTRPSYLYLAMSVSFITVSVSQFHSMSLFCITILSSINNVDMLPR